MAGTDGTTVGTGVSGSVLVGTGVRGTGVGTVGASVGVGAAVRGTVVIEGDALADADGETAGLADGAATCWDEITAAARRSSATSATAAKTVNTVDQRSTGRRKAAGREASSATFVSAFGRSSSAVASGSARVGFSGTCDATARAVPNGRTLDRSAAKRDAGRWRPDFRSRPD